MHKESMVSTNFLFWNLVVTTSIGLDKIYLIFQIETELVRLLERQNALHLPVFSIFFYTTFPEYWKIWSKKKYFTDHQTANTSQIFVAKKRDFSDLFFFRTSRSDRNSPETTW